MNELHAEFAEFYARRRHWLSYKRLQLLAGLALSVGLPWLATLLISPFADRPILFNSAIASAAASLAGFVTFRRFSRFPGITSIGSLFPALTVSYLTVIAVLFFARIDYSRGMVAGGFVLSMIVFAAMDFAARKRSRYLFAVLPHGNLSSLRAISGGRYDLHFLTGPDDMQGNWDGVIADFRATFPEGWERFLAVTVLHGIPVYHVKSFEEQLTGKLDIEHLSENMLGSFNQHGYLELRSLVEVFAAAAAVLILAPLFVAVAILVKLDSPGPVIFSQTRVGYRGRRFRVFKFRTMRHRSAAQGGCERDAAMTRTADQRITRVGRLLRKTRIDELPQIVNILRGEMSLIGPRPEVVALSDWYEAELPFYRYRHMVRPGLTGWAQVRQGHVTDLGDIHDKLRYDFYYIKNLSFWLDVVILLKTMRIVLTGHGAR